MSEPTVTVVGTPNPHAAKFVLDGCETAQPSRSYFDAATASEDPLANRLFGISGVRALLIVDNFVTVTKAEEVEWGEIVEQVTAGILAELER
ncbi:MAG: NifU N-terminal domain-containing protein [Gemmatimonadota bacterium]